MPHRRPSGTTGGELRRVDRSILRYEQVASVRAAAMDVHLVGVPRNPGSGAVAVKFRRRGGAHTSQIRHGIDSARMTGLGEVVLVRGVNPRALAGSPGRCHRNPPLHPPSRSWKAYLTPRADSQEAYTLARLQDGTRVLREPRLEPRRWTRIRVAIASGPHSFPVEHSARFLYRDSRNRRAGSPSEPVAQVLNRSGNSGQFKR